MHIPAREGSKRIKRKNMRDMQGNPMIFYSVRASLEAGITDDLYVNTDSIEIMKYVEQSFAAVKIYARQKSLANDKASSDEFNLDIINSLNPDTLMMINPVCPLIEATDIITALETYSKSSSDTLISCSNTQMQGFCENKPININPKEQLAPSQNNPTIQILNWAITIWDASLFKKRMNTSGFASIGEQRLLFPIDNLKGFKVSEESDFLICEQLLKLRMNKS